MGTKAERKTLRVFEAFAGIGAQVKALERAGIKFKPVGISEWYVDAILAYDSINNRRKKPPKLPNFEKQLEYLSNFTFSTDSQNSRPKERLRLLGEDKIAALYIAQKRSNNLGSIVDIKPSDMPDMDLLTYSFPCQDLSTGGKTLGMKKGSNTRSGLLWEIERILKGLEKEKRLPKYLLLENVSTLLAPSNKKDLELWLQVLTDLGYSNSKPMIVDASIYGGVRQDRKRCIIFSVLNEEAPNLEALLEPKQNPSIKYFYKNDYSNPIYKSEADEASLNPTPSREDMWRINKRDPVNENTIFHTITCNLDRSNNAGMVKYKGYPGRKYRLLTSREAMLLMGFENDDYEHLQELGLSYRKRNKLIGNSIVVGVLENVFSAVFTDYKKR